MSDVTESGIPRQSTPVPVPCNAISGFHASARTTLILWQHLYHTVGEGCKLVHQFNPYNIGVGDNAAAGSLLDPIAIGSRAVTRSGAIRVLPRPA